MHHSHIDKFAYQDTVIHHLDSRVKFIAVGVFTVLVLSVQPTSLSILVCYAIWPFCLLVAGKVPLKFVFKHILLISPFVVVLALSCPLYDRAVLDTAFGPFVWKIGRGWMRCFVILAKFVVTMMALIALVSVTRFYSLLEALGKIGFPKILVIQLGFIYRYIFVLIDNAHRILRARAARKLKYLGFNAELKVAASMIGSLFVRSLNSAEKIDMAMQARGFDGRWRTISKLRVAGNDILFCVVSAVFFAVLHFFIRPVLM